jgi:hypothetical protein
VTSHDAVRSGPMRDALAFLTGVSQRRRSPVFDLDLRQTAGVAVDLAQ